MPNEDLELQLDWDVSKLHDRWPAGPDNAYLMALAMEDAIRLVLCGRTLCPRCLCGSLFLVCC